ncbi:exopolysaccharide biosynthesis polyprenyl glycosylphosphotransferase [Gramella sp. AN32]|uniref:Exopolysaccharide biosynthesis polyprenyl glycosylphosphotransferase n=1 Tax=Christiangramia antarctica TaxID=2058158 RepID=A0ABW5X8L7_9FLAO|nr:exopolysaccharide biosynthesis polyprenyl glycosylphosphotransferase [Gramella sp. AN32]MCM4156119.1 undecaprenyl-phosphate glucose phosphotransferase [Gramella sp. AN32]
MRGSFLIIPFSVIFNLLIINITLLSLAPEIFTGSLAIISLNISWLLIGIGLNFYNIDRTERFLSNYHKFVRHFFVFALSYFTVLAFLKKEFVPKEQILILSILFVSLTTYRLIFFEVRKWYRKRGGNFLNVVILGQNKNTLKLEEIFGNEDYGYKYFGYFSGKNTTKNYGNNLGDFSMAFSYIIENSIDEIYCAASDFSNSQLLELKQFSDNNLKRLKILPDGKGIEARAAQYEMFENIPVLNLRRSPLEKNYAKYGKRIFDLLVSSLVIILVLSWLIPVIFLLNLIESRGPVLFKQLRHGYKKNSFYCYKFRSMEINSQANSQMCIKNDTRVTRLGRILRKTSIDELPQFINVFLGEMSIVGPRPHMLLHTQSFQKDVDNYLVRHFTKPGITGLAQVKGFRGEIIRKSDIVNRTRMDIFYLEKWSVLLDVHIMYETVRNAFFGDAKAY